ncbi:tRNA 2-selenouridine(34) synthase MnmH [Aneurinibacillus sp. REN35]|uniref:tRNA 2-selenouridine(34) synthase MnmH n=1 Tax=Aneurinibacillus sp. REN35 TaxID=3237286 RepID=UPI0035293C51
MFQDITVQELLEQHKQGKVVLVDVRSSAEFAEATIPGSMNIPLFTNEERAEIGTIYKQVSVEAAKERGLEIVSGKLPAFIKQFQQYDAPLAVFCWRGGMRSKTTATLLSLMGLRVFRLLGGVRAYRRWVVERLEQYEFRPQAIVIGGNTGCGKTHILHEMQKNGYPVLDLEAAAGHRGSIFGGIGTTPNNQKSFDALLLHQLDRVNEAPYVVMEAESRRIGKILLPEFLIQAKAKGIHIIIELPIHERVRIILEEYRPKEYKEQYIEAFLKIKKRIHIPIAAAIEEHLLHDEYEEAIRLLLKHYYDPRYTFMEGQYTGESIVIAADHVAEAAEAVMHYLK